MTETDRLYLRDAELREFTATVVEHDDEGRVGLDRTAFYPTGGGQPHDTGTLGPARVTNVTIREEDGLALSSRNAYLSSEERKQAVKLASALQVGLNQLADGNSHLPAIREQMKQHLEAGTEFETDYITLVDARTLEEPNSPTDQMVAIGAASLGTTRLIDNLLVPPLTLETLNSI